MDEELPTFEDLLEELETDLAELLAENPALQAELKRMAQEDRAREEELNRLRRPTMIASSARSRRSPGYRSHTW